MKAPSRLPWVGEGPVALARELAVPGAGRADVVIVEADGIITIVECKLARNASFRRRIIGQLFAYAGGLWGMDYAGFKQRFAVSEGRPSLTQPFQAVDGWREERFGRDIEDRLREGVFGLVFGVDVLTKELKQTVEFLDHQTPEQLRLRVLVCGKSATPVSHVPRAPKLDLDTLVAAVAARDPEAAAPARELLEWATGVGLEPDYNQQDGRVRTPSGKTLFRVMTYGEKVRVSLSTLRDGLSGDIFDEAVAELADLGFDVDRRHARGSLASFKDEPEKLGRFTRLMDRAQMMLPSRRRR